MSQDNSKLNNYPRYTEEKKDEEKPSYVASDTTQDNSKMENYPRSEQQTQTGGTPSIADSVRNIVAEKAVGSEEPVVEKPAPVVPEYDTTSNKNVFPRPQDTDNNFMQSIQMLPEEERNNALAQYLASGGQEAYRDYMAQRKYLEDPQAAAQREARERRNQKLIGAMNMVGALGNFVQAGANKDGRSVPVADTAGAYDKKLEAERKLRNENLTKANALGNQYRQMAGGIIKQGYQNAQDRAKLNQQERIAQAKLDLQAQTAADRALNNQRNYEINQQKLEIQKQESLSRIAKNKAAAAKALTSASSSSGGKISDKTHISISDGTNSYIIPKMAWIPENISRAWSLMSPELQQHALDMILIEISANGENTSEALSLFSSNRTKFFTMNAAALRNAIGCEMGRPGSEAMMDFIRSLSVGGSQQSTGSGQQSDGSNQTRRNGRRSGRKGDQAARPAQTTSEDDV